MATYADPELLLSKWLGEQLPGTKIWADPRIPHDWVYTAPIVHLQRGAGEGDTQLTLDFVLLDVDVYAKNADHARATAEAVRTELRLNLPLTTFPNGAFVTTVQTISAPFWAPEFERGIYRRTAAYRAIIHGIVA